MNGHLPLKEMREKEQKIFGGVGNSQANRSKVIICMKPLDIKIRKLPSSATEKDQNPGIHYLWYSIPMNDNRPGIWECEFSVTLSSFDGELLKDAALSFWLLSNLGGIGTRSRRGAGSFKITSVDSSFLLEEFSFESRTSEPFSDFLTKGLDFIARRFGFSRGFIPHNQTDFPTLSNAQVHILNSSNSSALDALDNIGRKYQDYRDHWQPDYDEIKNFITSGRRPQKIQRAEFGLPLSFRFRSLKRAGAEIKTTDRNINRSASSLLFHINELGNNYFTVVISFSSKLLPESTGLKVITQRKNEPKYAQRPVTVMQSPQGIKESFLMTLSTQKI